MRPFLLFLGAALAGAAPAAEAPAAKGRIVMFEDFSHGMSNWWVEGGERVWIEDGHLRVKADPGRRAPGNVATVWCKTPHPADVRVEFDAHVIRSSLGVNNVNFFLCYSDPSGKPLWDTRAGRSTAAYKLYHQLNGYIFTFLRDAKFAGGRRGDGGAKARIRIRRCPGFHLLAETYAYHCDAGRTYHVAITKRGGRIAYAVDGKTLLEVTDPHPLSGGLLGLRTFRTDLWWDNIRVTALK